ncbi:hypothetical protein HJC23_003196 [Cyclotella cryptica]|uniref:PDZ domain-containing protein n=1 Tax=Cyclotella cryptica TaxID=29204 RepID=A0ABD3NHD1_9STRA|eukprot:CCRYP_020946-RA/>CCRYP_020946-RA protein AED:0.51 eAED:-0.02 QI:0/-1/0/1/-1/1/1/0/1144
MNDKHQNFEQTTNPECWRGRHHQVPAYDDHYFPVHSMESQCSNHELNRPSRPTARVPSLPTSDQRFHGKHATTEGLIALQDTAFFRRGPPNSCLAPFQQAQPFNQYSPTNTTCDVSKTSSGDNGNGAVGTSSQCEMPTVTMLGVFEYFQEALTHGSRMLTNDAASEGPDANHNIYHTQVSETVDQKISNLATQPQPLMKQKTTTITATKQPGKRAGVIFSRLSNEQPNVAVISMIMHDSIFAQHNENYGGKLEGSVVVAVNGSIVDDARHAARLVIMAEGDVSLVVEISPLKSEVEVEKEKERIVSGAVDMVHEDLSGTGKNVEEIPSNISMLEEVMDLEHNDLPSNSSIVKRDPSSLQSSDVRKNNEAGSKQNLEAIPSVQSSLEEGMELEYSGDASKTDIIEMAPSSLKMQLKNRMESRKHSFNPLHHNYTSLMVSSSCSTSEGSNASSVLSSVSRRRIDLFANRLDDSSSIHSDTNRISRFLQRSEASSGGSSPETVCEETGAIARNNCIEDDIMTPKKNNINRKLARICPSRDSYNEGQQSSFGEAFENQWFKDTKQVYSNDSQQLHANNSSLTASTASLTYVPSTSYDDGSVIDIQSMLESRASDSLPSIKSTSKVNSESTNSMLLGSESNNATWKRVQKDGTLNIVPLAYNADEDSVRDLPTPMLIKRIENLFGNIDNTHAIPFLSVSAAFSCSDEKKTARKAVTPVASIAEKSATSPSISSRLENNARANDVFDRIMNKYAKMSFDSTVQETQSKGSNQSEIFVARDVNNEMSSLSSTSLERVVTNKYFSSLLLQNGAEYNSTSQSNSVLFKNDSEALRAKSVNPSGLASNNLHYRMKVMEIQLKESIDSDDNSAHFIGMGTNEYEDDDVSTLSRSTCLTIGSASFCSTDTKEIQSHVKSLVHGIVQKEIEKSGTMKKELEEALKSKAILESRVRKLERRNNKQQLELRKAHMQNETIVEEIDKEMTFHLTRKAAELKSCVEAALAQAEESKQRALEIARSDMEQEILALRAELDEALANGVHLDASLQRALALVESNRQTLRLAAESDARDAIKMKDEIENSFVSTVDEFEAWAEKQVTLMERLEEAMSNSGGIKAEDEAKLLKIKESLESAMCGMTRMQYRMKTRTQSGNYSGYV